MAHRFVHHKEPANGISRITYPDDASRCVAGAALIMEAASENMVTVLWQAIDRFGMPSTVPSYNNSCFVGAGGRKKPMDT